MISKKDSQIHPQLPRASWRRCLGFKPIRPVQVNLHSTNMELLRRHKAKNKQKKANGSEVEERNLLLEPLGFIYLLSLFLEMEDRGSVSYRTV